jgi:hypothetical protein
LADDQTTEFWYRNKVSADPDTEFDAQHHGPAISQGYRPSSLSAIHAWTDASDQPAARGPTLTDLGKIPLCIF